MVGFLIHDSRRETTDIKKKDCMRGKKHDNIFDNHKTYFLDKQCNCRKLTKVMEGNPKSEVGIQ